jgi:hypothetical protein
MRDARLKGDRTNSLERKVAFIPVGLPSTCTVSTLTRGEMAVFFEILPWFGMDAARAFMVAPVGGFNLFYHSLGEGTTFKVSTGKNNNDHTSLSIVDVTEGIRKAPDISKITKNPKQPLFVDGDDMTGFLRAASKGLTSDPSRRLCAITAKTLGIHDVTLTSKRGQSELLTVWALNEGQTTKISFRYLKYSGTWPPPGSNENNRDSYSKGVSRTKEDGLKYSQLLTRYYRHQTNIPLVFQSSEIIEVNTPFGKAITNGWYNEHLKPNLDKNADRTIFVVPSLPDAAGKSKIDNDPTGIMVAENPVIAWEGDAGDPFLLTAAHELAHTLGAGHQKEIGLLMTNYDGKQNFVMDRNTLVAINPPFQR